MDRTPYPARPQFWANAVQRALLQSEAVSTLGRDVCWLVAFVSAREDMLRYKRVPKWWTKQIMDDAGFTNKKKFYATRKVAIDHGWLILNGGGTGVEGEYFTDIPVQFAGANSHQQPHQEDTSRCEFAPLTAPRSEPTNAPLPIPSNPVTQIEGAALPNTRKTKFKKPTAEQVSAYAAERGTSSFDGDKFCDHYESNGWKIGGKGAMKNWQAAVRTWLKNGGTQSTGKAPANANAEADSAFQQIVAAFKKFDFQTQRQGIKAAVSPAVWTLAESVGLTRFRDRNEYTEKQLRLDFLNAWGQHGND